MRLVQSVGEGPKAEGAGGEGAGGADSSVLSSTKHDRTLTSQTDVEMPVHNIRIQVCVCVCVCVRVCVCVWR